MLSGSLKERLAQLKILKEEEKKAAELPTASPAPVEKAPVPVEAAAPGKKRDDGPSELNTLNCIINMNARNIYMSPTIPLIHFTIVFKYAFCRGEGRGRRI